MRLHSIKTCTKRRDGVVGMQLFLTSDPQNDASPAIALDPIGLVDDVSCETVVANGLTDIKLVTDDDEIGIEYTVGGEKKEFGDVDHDFSKVTFSDEKPIIGLYGKVKDGKLSLVGFLTLNK